MDEMTSGRLSGIARHDRPHGPVETVQRVGVTIREGIAGDFRGALDFDGPRKRQISLIEAESWDAALADMGLQPGAIAWSDRRANLLVSGIRLPRMAGARVSIGDSLVIETVMECNPCQRMDAIREGLRAALAPDWRGGVLGRVLAGGEIAVGDKIRIEMT